MDDNEAVVVAEETVKEVVAEERNFEAEAREMGWLPEEEYKGDKARWKPAEKFVEDGERVLPIIKANERRLREELKTLKEDVGKRSERLEKALKAGYERDVARYKDEISNLKARQEQAVEAGDVETFKAIDKRLDSMVAPEEPEAPAAVAGDDPAKIEAEFAGRHDWYGKDQRMTAYAEGYSSMLAKKSDNKLPLSENLKMVEEEMQRMFPDKFKKPAANGHAAVDGGGAFNGVSQSKKGFDSLPAEAKHAYERFDPKIKAAMTKAQYAEEYLNG